MAPTDSISPAPAASPLSGTWSSAGSMAVPRSSFVAATLRDGRVLVAGGLTSGNQPTATAELYDPQSNAWTSAASMNEARSRQTATLLADGRVLVAGGRDASGLSLSSAEVYDPTNNTWTLTGGMSTPRDWHRAVILNDGTALVAGGQNTGAVGNPILRSAELYDPGSGLWRQTADMVNAGWGSPPRCFRMVASWSLEERGLR